MIVALYGTGGAGRDFMPLLLSGLVPGEQAVFVDDADRATHIGGIPVFTLGELQQALSNGPALFNVSVANASIRRLLAQRCIDAGMQPISVAHSTAIVSDRCKIGQGDIRCAFTIVNPDSVVGNFFQANIYSYLGHDCKVGNYVTLAPHACINGNVTIGDDAYIGTGAMVKQGINIGERAVVGMGAVVVRDVMPGEVVVGNPARRL